MDFLVVGLGLGALAILGGIIMVTLVVWRSQRAARQATRPEEQRYHLASAAARNASGQGLIVAGVVILLATVGAVAGSLDDRTGSLLVATTATVAAIGLIVRDVLYRSRYPLPRRPRARPLETPVAASPARTAPLTMAPVGADPLDGGWDLEPDSDRAEAEFAAAPALDPDSGADPVPDTDAESVTDSEAVPLVESPNEVEAPAAAAEDPGHAGEPDSVIDVPYSFMRDDDPAAGERRAPYSFMVAHEHPDELGDTRPPDGAEVSLDKAARIAPDDPGDDVPEGAPLRQARPVPRLIGKERARTP